MKKKFSQMIISRIRFQNVEERTDIEERCWKLIQAWSAHEPFQSLVRQGRMNVLLGLVCWGIRLRRGYFSIRSELTTKEACCCLDSAYERIWLLAKTENELPFFSNRDQAREYLAVCLLKVELFIVQFNENASTVRNSLRGELQTNHHLDDLIAGERKAALDAIRLGENPDIGVEVLRSNIRLFWYWIKFQGLLEKRVECKVGQIASDVVQEKFAYLLKLSRTRQLVLPEDEHSIEKFFVRCVVNEGFSWLRRISAHDRAKSGWSNSCCVPKPLSPVEFSIRREEEKFIAKFLGSLKPYERYLVLNRAGEISFEKIRLALGANCCNSTLRNHFQKIMKDFKRAAKDFGLWPD